MSSRSEGLLIRTIIRLYVLNRKLRGGRIAGACSPTLYRGNADPNAACGGLNGSVQLRRLDEAPMGQPSSCHNEIT
jgi:hypothetical protein